MPSSTAPEGAIEQHRRVSDRRKPDPGMITDLHGRFPVNAADSILIGDKASDLEAARAAGLKKLRLFGWQSKGFCGTAFATEVRHRSKTGIVECRPPGIIDAHTLPAPARLGHRALSDARKFHRKSPDAIVEIWQQIARSYRLHGLSCI
jgi:hypothetical protein